MFKEVEFIASAEKQESYPKLIDSHGNLLPEVALVGRSNVGKSSLLNHLAQNKNLARISSTPGKTQLVNFFQMEKKYVFVDLPGYGFAKVSKEKQEQWKEMVQEYLKTRSSLCLILLLCDARHPPSILDLVFAKWALHFQKSFTIIFTKTDKLSKSAINRQCEENFSIFLKEMDLREQTYLPYSIKNVKMRNALFKTLEKKLKWAL